MWSFSGKPVDGRTKGDRCDSFAKEKDRMSKNEKQYRITQAQARRFQDALAELANQERPAQVTPRLWQAQHEAAESQWRELQEQIRAYEVLRAGKS
jgi:TfoX/Sxy family transcriptional regulator of competence genes